MGRYDDPCYTPGAWYAKRYLGCTCPRLDNDEGWGKIVDDEIEFLIQPGCPEHDKPDSIYNIYRRSDASSDDAPGRGDSVGGATEEGPRG